MIYTLPIVVSIFCHFANANAGANSKASDRILIELTRSHQNLFEELIIVKSGASTSAEELAYNSNSLSMTKLTFGHFRKSGSQVEKKIEEILKAGSVQMDSKSDLFVSPHEWQLRVRGEKISPSAPQFSLFMEFIGSQIENSQWKPVKLTSVEIKPPRITAKTTSMGISTKPEVRQRSFEIKKICADQVGNKKICRLNSDALFSGILYIDEKTLSRASR